MYIIKGCHHVFSMSREHIPVLKVPSGSRVAFETNDCFNCQITSAGQALESLNWNEINPATGPLYIEDCMPGDVLKVYIENIEIKGHGVMVAIPQEGLLGEKVKPFPAVRLGLMVATWTIR